MCVKLISQSPDFKTYAYSSLNGNGTKIFLVIDTSILRLIEDFHTST